MSDLASHTPQPSLPRLAWPLVISFTFRSLLTSIDIPYASTLGDEAVAAIGLAFPFEFAFIACWVGLSSSLTSHLGRAFGERHQNRMIQVLRATRHLILILSGIFLTLAISLWIGTPHLPIDPEVARNLQIYAPIVVASASLIGFWSILPDSLIKAHHDTRSTMIAGLLSGSLNLFLNTLFVFGLNMGILGIALATGAGRLGGLLYALHRAHRLENSRKIEWSAISSPDRATPSLRQNDPVKLDPNGMLAHPYRALCILGIPTAITYVLMGTENLFINAILSTHESSTSSFAAFAIYHRVTMTLLMPIVGVAVAILPFVSRLLGENRPTEIHKGLRQVFTFAWIYVTIIVIPGCVFLSTPLTEFLGKEESTRQMADFSIRYATPLAVAATFPFLFCRTTFEAFQRGMPGLLMGTLRYLILGLPLALLGAHYADRFGSTPYKGLLLGLILGSAVVSTGFWVWLRHLLSTVKSPSPPPHFHPKTGESEANPAELH
jgi:Na+-driven multidrug efflux pump